MPNERMLEVCHRVHIEPKDASVTRNDKPINNILSILTHTGKSSPKTINLERTNIYLLILLVFIYKLTLDYIYVNFITEAYSSIGLVYEFNKNRYIITTIIVFISIFPLRRMFEQVEKPSAIMMVCFYLIYFYPNCTLNSISNLNTSFFIFSLFYWLVLTLLYFYLPKSELLIKRRLSSNDPIYFYILLFSVTVVAVALVISYRGFVIKYDLTDVYKIREEVKYIDTSSVFGYIKPLASHFTQIALIFFLINKQKTFAVLMVIFQLMLFAFGAHKVDFFFLIITILIYILYRNRLKYLLLYGLIIANGFTIMVAIILLNSTLLTDIASIYARVLFTPNILSSYFFDFFSSHDFLYLRDHINPILGLENPYGIETPYLIAILFRNANNMQANTGLIGSDFAQFGWATLFILVPIRIALMGIMDGVSRGLDVRITIIVSFSYAFIFINGSLLGTLLSGGFIIVCLLLYLIPRKAITLHDVPR